MTLVGSMGELTPSESIAAVLSTTTIQYHVQADVIMVMSVTGTGT